MKRKLLIQFDHFKNNIESLEMDHQIRRDIQTYVRGHTLTNLLFFIYVLCSVATASQLEFYYCCYFYKLRTHK